MLKKLWIKTLQGYFNKVIYWYHYFNLCLIYKTRKRGISSAFFPDSAIQNI